jgi:hypothetical protein
MKYLIDNTVTYRVGKIEDVKALQETFENNRMGELKNFSYKQKDVKEKGEVVETYYVVTAKMSFNEEKDPYDSVLDVSFGRFLNDEACENEG